MEANTKVRPLLVLEINEIAWRFLDRFLGDENFPALSSFFKEADTFTTFSEDTGELSPWITWPSFHRGMSNQEHCIEFLGQDPASFRGVPIWEEYRKKGLSIGIAGSLQSWPPKDPGDGGFYIPDTFAKDEQCIPKWVEPVQRFNLQQTGANMRVVNAGSLFSLNTILLGFRLPSMGVRLKTIASVLKQLIGERIFRERLARRPIFQALLFWDIFLKLYDQKSLPEFSTFFTNHVASAMHRFWHHLFPEDFGDTFKETPKEHLSTILFAMESLEMMIREAKAIQKKHPELILVFATSMGQGAKVWKRYNGYAFSMPDLKPLLIACGLTENNFTHLLAMTPQVCAEIPNREHFAQAVKALSEAKTANGEAVFQLKENDSRLSISSHTAKLADIEAGFFYLLGKKISWADAGIQVNKVDPTSGYHIPEGILAIQGSGIKADGSRKAIKAREAKQLLMHCAGLV